MKTTQAAFFALLASAFVLSAILVVRLDQKTEPNTAQADGQNILQTTFQMMTARTRGQAGNGDESLFILDNTGGRMIVYKPDVTGKKMTPIAVIKLNDVFGAGGGGR